VLSLKALTEEEKAARDAKADARAGRDEEPKGTRDTGGIADA
jgi:hypothetical protein